MTPYCAEEARAAARVRRRALKAGRFRAVYTGRENLRPRVRYYRTLGSAEIAIRVTIKADPDLWLVWLHAPNEVAPLVRYQADRAALTDRDLALRVRPPWYRYSADERVNRWSFKELFRIWEK